MLEKRKYKRAEVEELLTRQKTEYLETINALKEKTELLSSENITLAAKVSEFEKENAVISSAIKSAEQKAEEIENGAKMRYKLKVAELKAFCKRFDLYFSRIMKAYPDYHAVGDAKRVFDEINAIVNGEGSAEEKINAVSKALPKKGKKIFDPQSKIDEYIAATGENGFSLDEVLNPGELHLEDLCKELGLTEEE